MILSKTSLHILLLHAQYSTFLFFNTVFLIYKTSFSFTHFLPTLIYHIISLSAPDISFYNGIILIFVCSIFLKILVLFIDSIAKSKYWLCFVFVIINSLVALIDKFLLKYNVKPVYKSISIFVEEMPNYILAVAFMFIEQACNSFWPYVLIVSLLYFFSGIFLLYNRQKCHKERNLNNNIIKTSALKNPEASENRYCVDYTSKMPYYFYEKVSKYSNLTFPLADHEKERIVYNKEYTEHQNNINGLLSPPLTKDDINILFYHNKEKRMTLYLTKILCTIVDILVYFFLVSEMPEQSFLIMYFSFDFLFKAIDINLPARFFYPFIFLKFILLALIVFSAIMFAFGHYTFLLLLFVANGLTNQIIYKKFDYAKFHVKKVCDFAIYAVVIWAVVWYCQKKKGNYEDFMFFSTVRL